MVWDRAPDRMEKLLGKQKLKETLSSEKFLRKREREMQIIIERQGEGSEDFYDLLSPPESKSPFKFDNSDDVVSSLKHCRRIICHKPIESRLSEKQGLKIVTAEDEHGVVESYRESSFKVSLLMSELPNNYFQYDLGIFLCTIWIMILNFFANSTK